MNRLLPIGTIQPTLYMVLFLSTISLYSQVLKKPTLLFNAPCASAGFNSFNVEFEWAFPLVNADNKFILELSGPTGDFTSPTTLATVSDKNTVFKFTFNFAFPSNTAGDAYKIRVRSTSPAKTSELSDSFPAYYMAITSSLTLNNYQDVVLCDGKSATISVNNYPNEASYNWYKNLSPISGQHGPSLTVSQPGLYFVEIDYGEYCSMTTASNLVEVSIANGFDLSLTGESTVTLCSGTYTIKANVTDPDLDYNWYKDNVLLTSNNTGELVVDASNANYEGQYFVQVDGGECSQQSNRITITSQTFDLSVDAADYNVFLPGDAPVIHATTTASSPEYQWYRNNVAISGATGNSYTVTDTGLYKVVIRQTTNCDVTRESKTVSYSKPSSFDVAIKNDVSYIACDSDETILSIEDIAAILSDNSRFNISQDIINRFTFKWYKDNVELSGENFTSLIIDSHEKNGTYKLYAELDEFSVYSNNMTVKLGLGETVAISSDATISCEGTNEIQISSSITDPTYTYKWFRNGTQVAETTPTLKTSQTGTYILNIEAFGCVITSNELIINPLDESTITLDTPQNLFITENTSKTVTASGGDYYEWYDALGNLLSASPTVTLSLEGEYYLRAFLGTCEITKKLTVTYKEVFTIPNVISPNGDGYNDVWILPNTYSNREEITVSIYDQKGDLIFKTASYQNDWPSSTLLYSAGKPVFYYKIVQGKDVLKQGTITIIR